MSQGPHVPSGSLRDRNRRAVVDVLRRRGQASRSDLIRELGLSRTTVSKLVAELQADGVVVENADATASSGVGRPPTALTLNPSAGTAVGIDFGHDVIRVVVADLTGAVLQEARSSFEVDRDAEAAIGLAATLVDELLAAVGSDVESAVGIGVAVAAPVRRDAGTTSVLPGWAPFSPGGALEQRLGRPVRMGNDANLGALAEFRQGAGRGARNAVYVMLSGGIGAGLVLDGELFTGHSGLTGELGHLVVDPGGAICRCGNRGCLETIAAAPAVLAALQPLHGADLTLERAIELAAEGDAGCRRAFTDAGREVGRAVGAVCTVINPELVIVGGDVSVVGDVLVDAVRDGISRATIPAVSDEARVVRGVLGERAEVLGAVGLVLSEVEADQLVPDAVPLRRAVAR